MSFIALQGYKKRELVGIGSSFIFVVFGVTSERFSKVFKKYLLVIKGLMAVLFFGFGIFLIWKA
jgi:threonine/homoserine/homoserine lactone efflux protein